MPPETEGSWSATDDRRGAGGDARRLIHIGDGNGDGLGRAAQRAVRSRDGDVIDVIAARIAWRFEVRCGLEGDRAGRGIDIEQPGIGTA